MAKSMPSSGRRSFSSAGRSAVALSRVLAVTPHQILRRSRLCWRSCQLLRYHSSVRRHSARISSTAPGPPTSRRYSRKIGMGSNQWPSQSMTGCPSCARMSAGERFMACSFSSALPATLHHHDTEYVSPSIAPGERRGSAGPSRSEENTSELQSLRHLVCRLLLEKKKQYKQLDN